MQLKNPTCGARSSCPINAVTEIIGDQWSLLILRDMLIDLRTRFSEFRLADEGVATNILAAKLKHLLDYGVIEKFPDPRDGRASIYLPTERALDMIPVLLSAMAWSEKHQPDTTIPAEAMIAYHEDPHGAAAFLRGRAEQFGKEIRP